MSETGNKAEHSAILDALFGRRIVSVEFPNEGARARPSYESYCDLILVLDNHTRVVIRPVGDEIECLDVKVTL